jgi:acetyl-CoA carboxylase biotin carboxylase subunit
MLRKVLIANRCEIALRVVRACRDLGIRSVAVYSDADRELSFVRLADEAVHIGPSPAPQSYLSIEGLIAAAKQTGADAVHPGYGFLSENPTLARAVADAGLTFVGPSAAVIEQLGSKLGVRRMMLAAGVPVPPGADAPSTGEQARVLAEQLGYPVLVKPSGGGGGRGMRVVDRPEQLEAALETCRREAARSFGDSDVYVEKLLTHARHVEVQILGDQHGNVIHVGDRDCSLQRRHQKLVEEAPAPGLTPAQHARVRSLAVRAAQAAGYTNAGTVEFLFDGQEFYLLEVNTRIQVEHCVTEAVTGFDLVAEQLRVASGLPLSRSQAQVELRGAAIEARVYAENVKKGFLPSPGTLKIASFPAGPWVREDRGFEQGDTISHFYDGMIAKLVVWGDTRAEAIARTLRALHEYRIEGVETNLELLKQLIGSQPFRDVAHDTRHVERDVMPLVAPKKT